MSSENNKLKEVVDALTNLIDHGHDCACTMCQKDKQTVDDNPDIVDAVANLAKQKNK